jgi:hypothetical protein
VSLKHKEAIASAFSIPEAKGNKIWQLTAWQLKTWQHTPEGETWLCDNPLDMESQRMRSSNLMFCWPSIVIYQYNRTNKMHYLLSVYCGQ